jgi:hypothetical protein
MIDTGHSTVESQMMVLIVTSGPEDHPPCWRGLQMLNAITAGMFTCKSRRTIDGGAMQPHELPPPAQMILLLGGFRISQALYAAAVLSVADQLIAGPAPAEVLARRAGAHPPSLHRLLRTLAGAGVFTEPEPSLFALTSLGRRWSAASPARCARWPSCSWKRTTRAVRRPHPHHPHRPARRRALLSPAVLRLAVGPPGADPDVA